MSGKKISIAFMGSPDASAELLEFVYNEGRKQETDYQVCLVWSQPPRPLGRGLKITPSPVEQFAFSKHLTCYTPDSLSKVDLEILVENKIDLIFVVAYGQMLPSYIFSHPRLGSFNLHFSLLPKYRGASPLQSAILSGDEVGGISFQTIRKKMDAGSIVLQKKFSISEMSVDEYLAKSLTLAKETFNHFIQLVLNEKRGLSRFLEQDPSGVSYCSKITKEDGLIRQSDSLEKIYRKYLAFLNWPGLYFTLGEANYQITHLSKVADITTDDLGLASSSVLTLTSTATFKDRLKHNRKRLFLVKNDGLLEIHSIKKSGKKESSASDFLNGCHLEFPLLLF